MKNRDQINCSDSDCVGNVVWQSSGVQFNSRLKSKAWVKAQVKDEVKDAFRKAPDRATVKAWV